MHPLLYYTVFFGNIFFVPTGPWLKECQRFWVHGPHPSLVFCITWVVVTVLTMCRIKGNVHRQSKTLPKCRWSSPIHRYGSPRNDPYPLFQPQPVLPESGNIKTKPKKQQFCDMVWEKTRRSDFYHSGQFGRSKVETRVQTHSKSVRKAFESVRERSGVEKNVQEYKTTIQELFSSEKWRNWTISALVLIFSLSGGTRIHIYINLIQTSIDVIIMPILTHVARHPSNMAFNLLPKIYSHIPIGSMVLVYMLTWLGYIDGIHVTIYSGTMDPSWDMIQMDSNLSIRQYHPFGDYFPHSHGISVVRLDTTGGYCHCESNQSTLNFDLFTVLYLKSFVQFPKWYYYPDYSR